MTTVLPVRTPAKTYNVVLGQQLLPGLSKILDEQGVTAEQVAIITDEHVAKLGHCDAAAQSYRFHGVEAHIFVIGAGDVHKTLATAEQLYHRLLDVQFRRSGLIIAVGGGVVGDVAGFVAATYQRGVRYVQVPTTLLAHDSSIGGKVGVNLSEAKNLVGAFHQPSAVVMDTDALRTLPAREWLGGMAEVIKHAIIAEPRLFHDLMAAPCPEVPSDDRVENMLAQAMQVKIEIVGNDVLDTGERMKLNVGHTIGHAVEQASGYQLSHGEAVSIGIAMESRIAVNKGWLSQNTCDQITNLLERHGLPITPPEYPFNQVMNGLKLDKKHGAHQWTFAVPFDIGDVRIVHDISERDVAAVWPQEGRR